jgi:hypothetical protein
MYFNFNIPNFCYIIDTINSEVIKWPVVSRDVTQEKAKKAKKVRLYLVSIYIGFILKKITIVFLC